MTNYTRPQCVRNLSIVSGTLIIVYTVLCLLTAALWKPLYGSLNSTALSGTELPPGAIVFLLTGALRSLPLAIPAFMTAYHEDGGKNCLLKMILSAVYIPLPGAVGFIARFLLARLYSVKIYEVLSWINAFSGFFSILSTAAVILLFSALSIEYYEYTRHTRIQGAQALDIQP